MEQYKEMAQRRGKISVSNKQTSNILIYNCFYLLYILNHVFCSSFLTFAFMADFHYADKPETSRKSAPNVFDNSYRPFVLLN